MHVQPSWHGSNLGRWYLYYTAGSSDNLDNQRSHVLKGIDFTFSP